VDWRTSGSGHTFQWMDPLIKVRKIGERLKGSGREHTAALGPELCSHRARAWVHAYAVGGAAYAFVPIPVPGSTTAGLVALEVTMVHAIGRIYGQAMDMKDAAALVTGLEVAGTALKTVAREVVGFIPGVGWLVRGVIAATAIEALGNAVIGMFERRHPEKLCVPEGRLSTSPSA